MSLVEDSHCAVNQDIADSGLLHEDLMQCAGFHHGHVTVCNVSINKSRSPESVCQRHDELYRMD